MEGKDDMQAKERGREGHGEEIRGGEKDRGEGRRERNGPPVFELSLRPWQ